SLAQPPPARLRVLAVGGGGRRPGRPGGAPGGDPPAVRGSRPDPRSGLGADTGGGGGMRRRLVVLGDCLLDRDLEGEVERLCPDAPVPVVDEPIPSSRPGGAGLAAALAAEDGNEVTLITALSRDEAGLEL